MKKLLVARAAVIPFLILLGCAHPTVAPVPAPTPSFSIPIEKFELGSPPASDSVEEKKESTELLSLQKKRSAAECAEGNKQGWFTLKATFGPEAGILTEEELARVAPFCEKVLSVVWHSTEPFKAKYKRKRPFAHDSRITPCIEKLPQGATSYPSGHATAGEVMGLVLADLYPAKAKAILAQGQKIGEIRLLIGVHHRSDVAAGVRLGEEIYRELKADPSFQAEFAALKQKD